MMLHQFEQALRAYRTLLIQYPLYIWIIPDTRKSVALPFLITHMQFRTVGQCGFGKGSLMRPDILFREFLRRARRFVRNHCHKDDGKKGHIGKSTLAVRQILKRIGRFFSKNSAGLDNGRRSVERYPAAGSVRNKTDSHCRPTSPDGKRACQNSRTYGISPRHPGHSSCRKRCSSGIIALRVKCSLQTFRICKSLNADSILFSPLYFCVCVRTEQERIQNLHPGCTHSLLTPFLFSFLLKTLGFTQARHRRKC